MTSFKKIVDFQALVESLESFWKEQWSTMLYMWCYWQVPFAVWAELGPLAGAGSMKCFLADLSPPAS